MQHCEDRNFLHPTQFGSRRHHRAIDLPFIEEMEFEVCRASGRSLAKFDNDAKSCYDRMIPSLVMLACRSCGLHSTVARLAGFALACMTYNVKIGTHVGSVTYKHSRDHAIFGVGQGAGNSPFLWAIISSFLFFLYDSRCKGATFVAPLHPIQLDLNITGFVDDSNAHTNNFTINPHHDDKCLLETLQQSAKLWNLILWTSGGSLAPSKCSYTLISYAFHKNGTPVLHNKRQLIQDVPITLKCLDTGEDVPIRCLSPYSSRLTLGCWKDPSGNEIAQISALKEKCDKYANVVLRSSLTNHEAWVFYTAIFLPSITYPLPVCHISRKALDKLQRQAFWAITSKCGFN